MKERDKEKEGQIGMERQKKRNKRQRQIERGMERVGNRDREIMRKRRGDYIQV